MQEVSHWRNISMHEAWQEAIVPMALTPSDCEAVSEGPHHVLHSVVTFSERGTTSGSLDKGCCAGFPVTDCLGLLARAEVPTGADIRAPKAASGQVSRHAFRVVAPAGVSRSGSNEPETQKEQQ